MSDTKGFWAIVELMGHRRVAGYVTEVVFGGAKLVRVASGPDSLELGDARAPMFGGAAVYAINPCSEAAALRARDDIGESLADYYDRITARPALPPHEPEDGLERWPMDGEPIEAGDDESASAADELLAELAAPAERGGA